MAGYRDKMKKGHPMPGFDSRVKQLYLDKPECLIHFPNWLMSPNQIKEYRDLSHLAIVEIAGRDSVAAAVKSSKEESFTDLVPTYVYTGTEHGPWSTVQEAVHLLSKRLPKIRVHRPIVLGSPEFWRALNGRFITEMISRYGYYTPCVGCHVYLHSARIPLSSYMGSVPIISGERESHDGTPKINQISEALDAYQRLAAEFGIRLLLPLRHIADGDQISNILSFKWKQGERQLNCVLSGNYKQCTGNIIVNADNIKRYLADFAYPVSKEIITSYIEGRVPNHLEIASRILFGNNDAYIVPETGKY
jgi:hypothetical protein